MKDFEGIEKGEKKSESTVAPTGKEILKVKRKNSATVMKGQNGESTEEPCLDTERKDQKNFALKQKKAILEQNQVKTRLDEGCVNKIVKMNTGNNTEEKYKQKTKCIGGRAKTNKEIPTLSDSQYEKLFQSVIDKSLEDSIGIVPNASRQKHELKRFQDDNKLLFVRENTEPFIDNANEEIEMQGVWKTKTKAKDKKVNRLSRKNKIITNINEASESKKERRKHKRKGQPKKIVPEFTRFIDDDEEIALDNYVAWVQCSRKVCGKWRRLKDNVDPATLPQDWICSQNPDPLYNMCDIPEELWDGRENDVIYAELVPGSIVWAKQIGYPWWPAMVEHDPQTGKYFMFTSDSNQFPSKYHVTFFDKTVSHAWISALLVKNFQELPQEKYISKHNFTKRINTGKKMAEEAQKVKVQDRLFLFGFAARKVGNGDTEPSEDDSSQGSQEIPWNVKDIKRSKSRKNEDDWNEDSANKVPVVAGTHQQKVKKEKDVDQSGDDLKRRRKQESPAQLLRKEHVTQPKRFRVPSLKGNSTGKVPISRGLETSGSSGIKEPEMSFLKANPKLDKVSSQDQGRSSSQPDQDLYTMKFSADIEVNKRERSTGRQDLLKGSLATLGEDQKREDFDELLQEAKEKKQETALFSDDDMDILTAKKSEEDEEFAEFMFEE
ncbi:zinc finger CW-type PWWP domain protein 1-like isoform X2 [Narcine bancroftii]|uniref:zinc finger CW-type PWWP domain protein 1-like isoform X2 n=1 Tax=Narcine bancroftii TaxID=1343680 RepID=UPI0038320666